MSHSPSSVCPACFSWQQGWRPAPVCWELIDSASSLAKGPAMVLSPCPACSRAGGVGRDTRSSGKMEVWLEGTDWKRREGGGGGGGLEWKREFGRGWTAARERQTCVRGDPASTHCHRQPQPQIIHPEGLKWSAVASQHSSVPRSAGSDICGMQAARTLFLDLVSTTSGMEFGGSGTKRRSGSVFIQQLRISSAKLTEG